MGTLCLMLVCSDSYLALGFPPAHKL